MMVTIVGKRTCHNKDHNSGLGFIKDTIDCPCSYFPNPHSHWLKACSCWHLLFLLDIAIQKSRCHKHQPAVWVAHFINEMDPSCDQTSCGLERLRLGSATSAGQGANLTFCEDWREAIRTPLLLDIRMLQKKALQSTCSCLAHDMKTESRGHGAWAQQCEMGKFLIDL